MTVYSTFIGFRSTVEVARLCYEQDIYQLYPNKNIVMRLNVMYKLLQLSSLMIDHCETIQVSNNENPTNDQEEN